MGLGMEHIRTGYDHLLFLLCLIIPVRGWRQIVTFVTAFTVGHSITLALAVTGVLALPSDVIEFLIPVTIVATCLENLIVRDRARAPLR